MVDLDNTIPKKWTLSRITSNIKTASSHIPRLFVELCVVFVGVYLAFLLTDYQEELEKRDIRIKFYESLIVEFSTLLRHLDEEERNMLWHLSAVEEIEQGARPRIPARPLYYSVPGLVLTAAFDSRNFESLNTDMINNVVRLTADIESLEQKIDRFNVLLTAVLEVQESDANCCFNEEDELVEDYVWYPILITEIYELNLQIRQTILESAIPNLQELKDS